MTQFDIGSAPTIAQALAAAHEQVRDAFAAIPGLAIGDGPAGEWSPAEHLDHLNRAVAPVGLALGLPKLALRLLFGPAPRPSRSFEELCAIYVGALEAGAKASGRFIPAAPGAGSPADRERHKQRLLDRWSDLGATLAARLGRWSERDLDRYRLPHPILGKLTVREMLFFTVCHNRLHAEAIIKLHTHQS